VVWQSQARALFLPSKEIFLAIFDEPPVAMRVDKYYQVSTIFANPIDYSFFLIALFIIFLSSTASKIKITTLGVFTLFIVFNTQSMASFLFLAVLIFIIVVENKSTKLIFYFIGSISLTYFLIQNLEFIERYTFISYKYSRLGIIFKTLPEYLSSNLKDILIGLGPDRAVVYDTITSYPKVPEMLYYDKGYSSFKDVYWVALVVQNGVIFLLFLASIFWLIYKQSKRLQLKDHLIIKRILVMLVIFGFINQILDSKYISLIFWVLIGVTINEIRTTFNHKEITH
jgi:hypothetical protein